MPLSISDRVYFQVIRMNKCVMGDHDWTTATMSTGCAFAEDPDNTDEVVLTNGLEECGMELSFTDTSIVYTVMNTILQSVFINQFKSYVTYDL